MATYLALTAALTRAKERASASDAADDFLTELLQMSAGTAGEIVHYRPFICAARWLEQNRRDQTVAEGDGAKFTGQSKPIRSLYDTQLSYDRANNLTIPEGWEVPIELTSLCEAPCSHTAPSSSHRFGTGSFTSKVRP